MFRIYFILALLFCACDEPVQNHQTKNEHSIKIFECDAQYEILIYLETELESGSYDKIVNAWKRFCHIKKWDKRITAVNKYFKENNIPITIIKVASAYEYT